MMTKNVLRHCPGSPAGIITQPRTTGPDQGPKLQHPQGWTRGALGLGWAHGECPVGGGAGTATSRATLQGLIQRRTKSGFSREIQLLADSI